jgi:hypothetical protein
MHWGSAVSQQQATDMSRDAQSTGKAMDSSGSNDKTVSTLSECLPKVTWLCV